METTEAIAEEDLDAIPPIVDRHDIEVAITIDVSTNNTFRKRIGRNMTLQGKTTVTVPGQNREVIEARKVDREIEVAVLIEIASGHDLGQGEIATSMVSQCTAGKGRAKRAPHETKKNRCFVFHVLVY